jgi:hypothetical protein
LGGPSNGLIWQIRVEADAPQWGNGVGKGSIAEVAEQGGVAVRAGPAVGKSMKAADAVGLGGVWGRSEVADGLVGRGKYRLAVPCKDAGRAEAAADGGGVYVGSVHTQGAPDEDIGKRGFDGDARGWG